MLKKETQFIIYTAPNCPKCEAQKEEWFNFGIEYEERDSSRLKNPSDEIDREGLIEASMNNMELPIVVEWKQENIFPAMIREDKIWDKFCNERCKLREKCMLELVDETECPIVTRIVELDYVKK